MHLLKTSSRISHLILKNKKNLLLGMGALAFAGAVGGIFNHFKNRRKATIGLKHKESIHHPSFESPKIHPDKKKIYKAPPMAAQHLMKH